ELAEGGAVGDDFLGDFARGGFNFGQVRFDFVRHNFPCSFVCAMRPHNVAIPANARGMAYADGPCPPKIARKQSVRGLKCLTSRLAKLNRKSQESLAKLAAD